MIETTPYSLFKTVFIYCAIILFAPITTFFALKYFFFEGLLGTGSLSSNVWSAVMAVVVLHIALGLFIYKAYFEGGKTKPDEKVD
ncbi:VMA21 domain containing protein [Asbolus verrucosus]|uniref:Vacuolar ATPase assembly integral membrane protein VMA21 homolog n=1 Tax=Asbolus verrucosus TaxID=1661398 RepID=A0A482WDM3_ASBVE|nr:VMA21 domain containing protein [Asbolus verrucosus]